MSILVDLDAASRVNSFTRRPFARTTVVATAESFAPGQVVSVFKNPLDQTSPVAGVVLGRGTRAEYDQIHAPFSQRPENQAILATASFYRVGIDD